MPGASKSVQCSERDETISATNVQQDVARTKVRAVQWSNSGSDMQAS